MTLSNEKKVVTTSGLAQFIELGGKVFYQLQDDNPRVWGAWCVHPSGRKERIYVSTSGKQRTFKSADALLEFHARFFPNDKELSLQIHKEKA